MQIDKKTLRKIFLIVSGAILFWWLVSDTARVGAFFSWTWKLIAPFATGTAIAFIFNVPMRAVERYLMKVQKPGLRRALAILITLVLVVLVLALVVVLLIPQIEMTVESLVATLPVFFENTVDRIVLLLEQNPEIQEWVTEHLNIQQLESELTRLENIDWSALIQKVVTFAGNSMSTLLGGAFNAIGSVTNALINGFVSIAFAFYGLARKEILARQGRRLLYALLPEHIGDEVIRVLRLSNRTFSNFISGQCLEACILGGMFAVTMLIFNMPYIPLVSVVIAITALVPIVGAFIGCFIGAFFILVQSPMQAVWFVVMFLVLQQIEGNLIYPKVVGTSIGLPGMWVLAALTVGGELAGIAGMMIMIPLASVIYALLREFTLKRVREKGIDPEKLRDHPVELKSAFKEKREKRREQRLLRKMQQLADKHHIPYPHAHQKAEKEETEE